MDVKEKLGKSEYIIALYLLYAVWLIYNISFITPMADDWRCAAAPYHNDGTWYRVLPFTFGNPFWRPFEGLLGYFLGENPFLFPYLNQGLVVIGHLLLMVLLYNGLKRYTGNNNAALGATAIFALSPATVGTTSQMDAINQCWALLCGVIATKMFIKGNYYGKKKYIMFYLFFAMCAVLFKENGICWFLVPVFLCIINDYISGENRIWHLLKGYREKIVLGIVGSIAYFVIRFSLQGSISLGGGGRYAVQVSVIDIIKNNIIIFGSSMTTIDSLAVFMKPHSWGIIVITTIVTILSWKYLIEAIIKFKREYNLMTIILLFLVAIYINLPLTIMPHVSEMSAYQSVFVFAFFVGIVWKYIRINKWSKFTLGMLLICMLSVSTHKFMITQAYAENVRIGKQQYQDCFINMPRNVLIFYVEDVPLEYSTYMQPLGHGLEQGRAFRSDWNWMDLDKNGKIIYCKSVDEIDYEINNYDEYDTVFIQYQSGRVVLLRN